MSTRSLAMQIQRGMAPEIPNSDLERRAWPFGPRYNKAMVTVDSDRNFGRQRASGSYPLGAFNSAGVFGI